MEFLMTYGWAILIVVIAVAALAAFGVFNPQRFAQERCVGDATKFACTTNAISLDPATGAVQIGLTNGAGETVNITEVRTTGDCGVPTFTPGTAGTAGQFSLTRAGSDVTSDELRPNDNFILALSCDTQNPGGVFDETFTIEYEIVGGIGNLRGTVEAVVKT